jgi:hypothetical protein
MRYDRARTSLGRQDLREPVALGVDDALQAQAVRRHHLADAQPGDGCQRFGQVALVETLEHVPRRPSAGHESKVIRC